MSTDDGWTLAPDRWLDRRPPTHDGARLSSCHVTVRDGTRLAVDVHLPGREDDGARVPAILVLTPYYRRFALREGHDPATDACPTVAYYRDLFVPRGYALVAVDVRGSGASFGCRDGFRSPRERLDHHDVADWVARQPWCDGNLGATGISYPGAAADFLASTAHPAVKAVAPLCAVWDTWSNHLYPGGLLLTCVSRRYGQLAEALDLDRRHLIPPFAYFAHPDLAGPAPVDEDADGALLAEALHAHHANFDMQDFAQQLRHRDDGLGHDPGYTGAVISPCHYASRDADRQTAVYSISGWMDGAGYSTGTVQRYLWLSNPATRLMLGPWDHGARANVSPWRARGGTAEQRFMGAEVLRFFDAHLRGDGAALEAERPVHYFTMGEERWKAADTWPPPARELVLHAGAQHVLAEAEPAAGRDPYQGDYALGTGDHTRYDRLYIASVETYYDDWDGREDAMLCYTGTPLAEPIEVTGHPWAELHFTCSQTDATFFVYLSDVTPDGRSVYVTEGVLRALHRAEGPNPDNVPATSPVTRGFRRADARLLTPDAPEHARIELLATSYRFAAGHRLRMSIALADADHYTRVPDGRPPRIELLRGPATPTRLVLPVVGGS